MSFSGRFNIFWSWLCSWGVKNWALGMCSLRRILFRIWGNLVDGIWFIKVQVSLNFVEIGIWLVRLDIMGTFWLIVGFE